MQSKNIGLGLPGAPFLPSKGKKKPKLARLVK
jgi:hypothetical protein